ncbi:uncharacterized protein LOC121891219 isoform X4 [Thunnus maccoyii]|uniref:uncharacterized protein LOC121891219 isoform X4 n=1 Tax=Thunnus maccoyii TaxID=8240 RepID=UPI001C4C91D7|nr:uncharacterized protein LOC121891219 isoform X4 [Thunnus maccoyii]
MVCVIFDFFKSNCRVTGAPEKKSILKYPSEVCATSQNVHGGAVLSRCGDFGSQGCDFTPLWHVIGQFKTQVLDSSGRSLLLSVRTQSEKKSHSLSTHEWVKFRQLAPALQPSSDSSPTIFSHHLQLTPHLEHLVIASQMPSSTVSLPEHSSYLTRWNCFMPPMVFQSLHLMS